MTFQSARLSRRVNPRVLDALRAVVASVILTAASAGCQPKDDAESLAQARSMFREVFDEFNAQKGKFFLELEQGKNTLLTFQEAIKAAQDKDAEFRKVYTQWRKVESEAERLHKTFVSLVEGADSFYAELYARAKSITTNDELKTTTLRSLDESKQNYIVRLQQSRAKIEALDGMYTKVRDRMTALEINYSLEVLESSLTQTFQEIDQMIESLTDELDRLLRESELLLSKRLG